MVNTGYVVFAFDDGDTITLDYDSISIMCFVGVQKNYIIVPSGTKEFNTCKNVKFVIEEDSNIPIQRSNGEFINVFDRFVDKKDIISISFFDYKDNRYIDGITVDVPYNISNKTEDNLLQQCNIVHGCLEVVIGTEDENK